MARYFLTGATGFVGAEVAKQLITGGHQVVALVRVRAKAALLAMLGAEVHEGEITERQTLRTAMQGADGVFHIAGWYKVGVRDASAIATRTNVDGTREVLGAMRDLGIAKGVYTSTVAVFSDTHGVLVDESYRFTGAHLSIYDRTKWEAHYHVALPMIAAGLPLVIVQPGVVYGPGDTSAMRGVIVNHLRGRLPVVPARSAYCWGHIEDTAHAHIAAMERGRAGETYIIAGPAHTLREAIGVAAGFSGRRAPLATVIPGVMTLASRVMETVEAVVSTGTSLRSETLRLMAGVTYLGSHEKARQALGFTPRSIQEGFRHMVEHELRLLGRMPPG